MNLKVGDKIYGVKTIYDKAGSTLVAATIAKVGSRGIRIDVPDGMESAFKYTNKLYYEMDKASLHLSPSDAILAAIDQASKDASGAENALQLYNDRLAFLEKMLSEEKKKSKLSQLIIVRCDSGTDIHIGDRVIGRFTTDKFGHKIVNPTRYSAEYRAESDAILEIIRLDMDRSAIEADFIRDLHSKYRDHCSPATKEIP